MSKKRAFVRYTKSGEIVPGSLIITTNGGYPDKSSLWKEVTVDQCCDGGSECIKPISFIQQIPVDLSEFGTGPNIAINLYCDIPMPFPNIITNYSFITRELLFPVVAPITSIEELIDIINTTFANEGISASVSENLIYLTVSNTDLLSTACSGNPNFQVVLTSPALPNPNN